jgi:hypothetical protein
MPTSEDFKTKLYRMTNEALFQGKTTAEINAGDLHRRLVGYPAKEDFDTARREEFKRVFSEVPRKDP